MQLATSEVPTRQGVQKPQLSCAKKWAKIACHLEHVAMRAEDHEGASRRHVLEGNAARELVHRQASSGRGR
jgi:hypothetical protein